MKIKYLVLFFILLSQSLLAWGNTGHRIVGEIAETYLTKNAKMQIKKLIGHHDLSRISNWGDEIKADSMIFSLSGKAHDILRVERLLLNILCHLRGIATLTAQMVKMAKSVNPKVEILATRKTIPGIRVLEKKAVVHGGGMTHRMRLDDAVLIKDNHLRLCKDIKTAVGRSRLRHPDLMIEVEADNSAQALEVAKSGADRVMLDNFTVEDAKKAVLDLRNISDIEIEISGGVTADNIESYAPFADFISLGSLTMAAPPVDFTLHVN